MDAGTIVRCVVFLLVVAALVAVAIVFSTSAPQGNLAVHVQNDDGAAVPNATIAIDGRAAGRTNRGGNWSGAVSEGEHIIRVTAPTGVSDPPLYQPVAMPVDVPVSPPDTAAASLLSTITLPGWSSLTPWFSIAEAVDHVLAAEPVAPGATPPTQTVKLYFSFIPAGVVVASAGGQRAVAFTDYVDHSITPAQFSSQIQRAFGQWKALFEDIFSVDNGYNANLEIVFEKSVETGTPPPLFADYQARSFNSGSAATSYAGIGDFRLGMFAFPSDSLVLAYAYSPANQPLNLAGDVLFNAHVDWRLDDDAEDSGAVNVASDGGFSVLYVAVHEIGHALGIGHNVSRASAMAPVAGKSRTYAGLFGPAGLLDSSYERAAVLAIYGRGTGIVDVEELSPVTE